MNIISDWITTLECKANKNLKQDKTPRACRSKYNAELQNDICVLGEGDASLRADQDGGS